MKYLGSGLSGPLGQPQLGKFKPRTITAVAATAGAVALGTGVYYHHHRQKQGNRPRLQLNPSVVEALAGAIGEVAQIGILYPLDTIKVRCQTAGASAGIIIEELLQGGLNVRLFRKLYAGVIGAAVCSIAVGAVHYASYEACRRGVLQMAAKAASEASASGSGSGHSNGSNSSSSSGAVLGAAGSSGAGAPPAAIAQHGQGNASGAGTSTGAGTAAAAAHGAAHSHHAHHHHSTDDYIFRGHVHCSEDEAEEAAAAPSTVRSSAAGAAVGAAAVAVAGADGAAGGSSAEEQRGPAWLPHSKVIANLAAAVVAALATAVVEAPVELFRHNVQAGLVRGSFVKEMVSVVRREGPAGLYWGFLPHCFEAWPHDISELLVYGQLKDFQEEVSESRCAQRQWLREVPVHVWDLCTGAAAGAAAVVVSMPFDTVKTYMQTHGTDLTGKGLFGSASLFVRTGRKMVSQCGLGCLYVGVTPRLLQQVPSAMVCWWAIEACKRTLHPYTMEDPATGAGGGLRTSSAAAQGGGGPASWAPAVAVAATVGGPVVLDATDGGLR